MTQKEATWLEVSLNGAHSKESQPNGPHDASKIIEEGLACAEAGAAIVHFHAFAGDTDQQVYDSDSYGKIIEGIRKHSDALVYGTVAMIGGYDGAPLMSPQERYRPTEELLQAGLLDSFVVDAGLVNFTSYAGVASNAPTGMYLNPVDYIRYAIELAKKFDVNPTCGIWEPGFLRTAAAVAEACGLKRQIMYKMVLTDSMAFGLPAETYALEAYGKLAAQFAPNASLMMAAAGADVLPLIGDALAMGAHVRIGLEDAKLGCPLTNLQLVKNAVENIEDAGGTIATPETIRIALRP